MGVELQLKSLATSASPHLILKLHWSSHNAWKMWIRWCASRQRMLLDTWEISGFQSRVPPYITKTKMCGGLPPEQLDLLVRGAPRMHTFSHPGFRKNLFL